MKKYHGQSLSALVPDLAKWTGPHTGMMIPYDPPTLTAKQFADLDIWTVPRRRSIGITDVPAVGEIIMTRTSKALRFHWTTFGLPIVAEAALRGAAKVCRQPTFKVAYHRRKQYIVVWTPLSRKGSITIERLCATFMVLWSKALKLIAENAKVFALLMETKTKEK
jgi:hypothetical protein